MGSHRVAAGTRPGLGVIYRVAGAHMPLARMQNCCKLHCDPCGAHTGSCKPAACHHPVSLHSERASDGFFSTECA
jgi:hypothetical protein